MSFENWIRLYIFLRFMDKYNYDLQHKPDLKFYNEYFLWLKE